MSEGIIGKRFEVIARDNDGTIGGLYHAYKIGAIVEVYGVYGETRPDWVHTRQISEGPHQELQQTVRLQCLQEVNIDETEVQNRAEVQGQE